MRIGIFGSPDTIESQWLEEEAKRRKHKVERFSVSDLTFIYQNNKFEVKSGIDLEEIDIYLVRGLYRGYMVKDLYFNKSTEGLIFLRYVKSVLKKPIVDERLAKKPAIISKMATTLDLSQFNLPLPYTIQFPTKQLI